MRPGCQRKSDRLGPRNIARLPACPPARLPARVPLHFSRARHPFPAISKLERWLELWLWLFSSVSSSPFWFGPWLWRGKY